MDAEATLERIRILAAPREELGGQAMLDAVDRLLTAPALVELANLTTLWTLGMRDEAVARIKKLPTAEESDPALAGTLLSVRLLSMLSERGVNTIGELARWRRREKGIPAGFGPVALAEIDLVLRKHAEEAEAVE
jgi:hypothetical protein